MTSNHIPAGARRQRVVIDRKGNKWIVTFDGGRKQSFDTPADALSAVKAEAKMENAGATITVIEWCNVPDGWKPPEGS